MYKLQLSVGSIGFITKTFPTVARRGEKEAHTGAHLRRGRSYMVKPPSPITDYLARVHMSGSAVQYHRTIPKRSIDLLGIFFRLKVQVEGGLSMNRSCAWRDTSATAPATTITCANNAEVLDGLLGAPSCHALGYAMMHKAGVDSLPGAENAERKNRTGAAETKTKTENVETEP
ncbi:hypothetical protein EDB85DRAFT_1888393 [Lactarius pseudohatsudake]|nr:hypothetical protein EDB85DRAFT_1888393 [Lactarius pseudohatsudake]